MTGSENKEHAVVALSAPGTSSRSSHAVRADARVAHVPAFARRLHPLHAMLLAFPVALFLGALASDYAYWQSYHIQWANFSSWLIAGGLLFGGFALLWALVDLVRIGAGNRRPVLVYFGVLAAAWVLGFINALVHAKDAWAAMPEGLILSAVVAVLALAAGWLGYSGFRTREVV
ncbi:DUF2231 domain-containing protein [Falsiroseomonas sp. E2-1-a20]|uniref:DUF2231 domain-containing protein n=1 Tax=Falsiroseomonas sp. E2-1-a20 TaxID=3239300 RepID=UPI003F34F93E